MKIVCYQSDSDLAGLRRDWNLLAAGEPLVSWEWLTSWWQHYGPAIRRRGGKLLVLAVESQDGERVGLAPWYIAAGLRGRVIRFLGDGDVCTDYLSLLAAESCGSVVVECLAAWLAATSGSAHRLRQCGLQNKNAVLRLEHSDRRYRWDLIEFEGVDAADVLVRGLMEALARHGIHVASQAGARCWRIVLPPTWDEFLARLSKSHRKQVGRCQRRYLDTGRAVLRTAETAEELARGLNILRDLHARRRQSLGDAGRFTDARFAGFLAQACQLLLESGQLRLCWLEIDGQPAAAEMHVVGPRTVHAYQSGVEPGLLDHEPGRIITLATLRRAIADGFGEFDFMRGDEPYKAHWRAEPRPQVIWRAVAPRLCARARFTAWQVAREVRARLKQLLRGWQHPSTEIGTEATSEPRLELAEEFSAAGQAAEPSSERIDLALQLRAAANADASDVRKDSAVGKDWPHRKDNAVGDNSAAGKGNAPGKGDAAGKGHTVGKRNAVGKDQAVTNDGAIDKSRDVAKHSALSKSSHAGKPRDASEAVHVSQADAVGKSSDAEKDSTVGKSSAVSRPSDVRETDPAGKDSGLDKPSGVSEASVVAVVTDERQPQEVSG